MQTASYNELDTVLSGFLAEQKLPESYRTIALRWFIPVLAKVAACHNPVKGPLVVGINGCQGSGKSTLAALAVAYFKAMHGKTAIAISIDDFYLTVAQRKQLAKDTHSLLRTRGVPGTHDLELAESTLAALTSGLSDVKIPRFNKAIDDRAPMEDWDTTGESTDIVIVEGWCMGAQAQPEDEMIIPVNDLEEFEDRSGVWRNYVNQKLAGSYADFFSKMHVWLMLKAPSFDCVYRWRLEQEEKLRESLKPQFQKGDQLMSPQQIRRFIQYYQRVTENTLAHLPDKAQVVFEMDDQRAIIKIRDKL